MQAHFTLRAATFTVPQSISRKYKPTCHNEFKLVYQNQLKTSKLICRDYGPAERHQLRGKLVTLANVGDSLLRVMALC
jgi:hypothetical protein